MDADQLRLILLALGATLVVLIYGWDRYKRSRRRLRSMPRRNLRHQPVFHDEQQEQETESADDLPHMQAQEAEPVAPLELSEENAIARKQGEVAQHELEFSALEESDYVHMNPDLQEDLPRMVIQIALVRKDKPFTGPEIEQSMADVGLKMGEMAIYHHYDQERQDQVLFSIASLVEPGQFPTSDMDHFTTPGLLLFTQLPGIRDGMLIYSEMLFTAERLAGLMGGILQDDTHSVLSKQTIEHTRDSILEHRRKVQLARKR